MKSILRFFVGALMLGAFFVPQISSAITTEELQVQISNLLAQIEALRAQLAIQTTQTTTTTPPTTLCYDFASAPDMRGGDKGPQIIALQTALMQEGFDMEITGYFGPKTFAAVVAFQEKYAGEILTAHNLTRGTGYVGKATRMKLHALYGCAQATGTVAVISPNGGEIWQKGTTYNILWGAQNANATVELKLLNSYGFAVSNIASGVANTGIYAWTVPASLPDGDYKMFVSVGSSRDESDGTFRISGTATTTSTITVLSPNGGEVWEIGKTYDIKWNNTTGKSVNIDIIKGITSVITQGAYLPSQTSRNFTVPTSLQSGTDYKVTVSAFDDSTRDTSDAPFSIVATTTATSTPVTLTGVTPSSGPIGTTVVLTGCGSDSTSGFTLIYTGPKSGSAVIPVETLPNVGGCGYMTFTVPSDFPAGTYTLTVKNNQTGTISTNSMTFAVTSIPVTLTSITPASGPVGTNVTIYGCGPESALGYSLTYSGPANGTLDLVVSPTTNGCGYMTYTTPDGAPTGTYTVYVKNNSTGQTSTNSMTFTVTSVTAQISSTSQLASALTAIQQILESMLKSITR